MEKYTKYLLIAAIVILLIIAIKKGIDERLIRTSNTKVPYDEKDIPQSFNAMQEAEKIYNTFVGWFNSTDKRMRVIVGLTEMNDSQITLVYNTFNKMYSKKVGNLSMSRFIFDDFIIDFTGYKDKLQQQLDRLNLI